MNNRVRNILEHMLEDAQDAIKFAKDVGCVDEFSSNKLYRKAVIMSILNIGELTKKLSSEYKATHKDIPWRKISGMRDIVAHGYHMLDDDIIWDVVTNSIPDLAQFLQKQLNDTEQLV